MKKKKKENGAVTELLDKSRGIQQARDDGADGHDFGRATSATVLA
jgi:hypothetical protein